MKKLFRRQVLRRMVLCLVFIYAGFSVIACSVADQMIFPAPAPSYQDGPEILKVTMEDGTRISALHLPNSQAKFTVLYSHGNAEDLGHVLARLESYRLQGFAIFAYDYPGYGTSEGQASARAACEAAEASLLHLTGELGVSMDRVIVHGRSVGGGPAHYLAHRHPVAGLISESAFVSAFRVMTKAPLLPFDRLRNLSFISEVDCPVLVVHGVQDRIIEPWHAEKLYSKAKEPKTLCWLEQSTHNSMPTVDQEKLWRAIRDFAEMLDR